MWSVKDLWRIFNFLKDGTIDTRMDSNTRVLSESERQIASNLFTNNLDQICFNSNDYKRLKKFFIDWYATHRTLTSTQKNVSDLFSLPEDHINELFRSFGYDLGLKLVPLATKVNLFLDLVNLYKKKGTPEALIDILDYYGFTDADLIEYWLLNDNGGNLVFRGESVRGAATGSTTLLQTDVAYNTLTNNDPHWMLSKSQAEYLISQNKIALPSKTPYFSLSSTFSLEKLKAAISVVVRKVQDQYETWDTGGTLPQDVTIKNVGHVVSLLEVYLATIYALDKKFGQIANSTDSNILCFDGTELPDPLYKAIDGLTDGSGNPISYNALTSLPDTRDERAEKLEQFADYFSRPLSSSFLDQFGEAGNKLALINPTLKSEVDSWFDQAEEENLIMYLIGTLDIWIRTNIDSRVPSLTITVLGFGFKDEVKQIIEFFKPYRARLAFIDTAFSIDNPLTNSVRLDDYYTDLIRQYVYDMPKAHSGGDQNYDEGAFYDTGIVDDNFYEFISHTETDTEIVTEEVKQNITEPAIIEDIEITDDPNHIIVETTTEILNHHPPTDETTYDFDEGWHFDTYPTQYQSFPNYDEGFVFDCMFGSDLILYKVEEIIIDNTINLTDEFKIPSMNQSHQDSISISDEMIVGEVLIDRMSCLIPGAESLIHNDYQTDGGNVTFAFQTGGFYNFDEPSAEFDGSSGKDLCEIYVTDLP